MLHGGAARRARGWPETQGTVISSEISPREVRDQDGDRATLWDFEIDYAYEVEGRRFHGARPFLSRRNFGGNEKAARAWLAEHAAGATHPGRALPVFHRVDGAIDGADDDPAQHDGAEDDADDHQRGADGPLQGRFAVRGGRCKRHVPIMTAGHPSDANRL